MARIRTIKPTFFTHENLFDAEKETGLPLRIAFAGLWTQADREGRFRWRPRELKLGVLPYDDVDFSRVLHALATRGFLVRYASGGEIYGFIPSWRRHQHINNREASSDIPDPHEKTSIIQDDVVASPTRKARVPHASPTRQKGKGKEGEEGKGRGRRIFLTKDVGFSKTENTDDAKTDGDRRLPAIKKNGIYAEAFAGLWKAWQPVNTPKGSKKNASEKWEIHVVKPGLDPEMVVATASLYCRQQRATGTYTCHVERWITRHGWLDDLGPVATPGDRLIEAARRLTGDGGVDVTPDPSEDSTGDIEP